MKLEEKNSIKSFFTQKTWLWAGILIVSVTAMIITSYFLFLNQDSVEEMASSSYDYHIALISEETDAPFWKDVYRGAVEAGIGYGAYVEQVGDELAEALSVEDAFRVAIYEGVDGILLRPSDGIGSEQMINKACENGIPVIIMQKDVAASKRQGFVGINDYFLGQEYGKRVLKIADKNTRLVTVLFPGSSFNETSRNWFRQGLSNTVQSGRIRLDFQIIRDDRGLNNAEDVIHKIAEGHVEQPDILICLDEIITQSTCQLIHDRGLADEIRIIGSYVSEDILQAIEDGYLDSTITIDPKMMGQMSIDALMTYKKYHMVSYYTEVDTMLIDQNSVAGYRRKKEDGEELVKEK